MYRSLKIFYRVLSCWVARAVSVIASIFCLFAALVVTVTVTAFADEHPPQPTILTEKSCAIKDHFVITLLLGSNKNISPKKGVITKEEAYIKGAQFRVRAINSAGGIAGKPVCLNAFDDYKQADQTVKIVDQALLNPRLIALVGLNISSNAQAVVKKIGQSGVPLLSDISVDRLFAPYKNIFTMSKAVSDDTAAFMDFLTGNYKSVMFIGGLTKAEDGASSSPDLFAAEFLNALENPDSSVTLVKPHHWIEADDEEALDKIVADIQANQPEILCLAAWTAGATKIMTRLAAENISIPVFLATGSVPGVAGRGTGYQGKVFQVGGRIPNLVPERLAILKNSPDIKRLEASLKGHIGNGLIFSDLIAMIGHGTKGLESEGSIAPEIVRQSIIGGLTELRDGRQFFPGLQRNWSFTDARASARNAFILWTPHLKKSQRLWKTQKIRSNTGYRKIGVAYASIDLVRIEPVDTNNHSFDAEFYLSLSATPEVTLEKFAFSNAVKGEDGTPLVYISEINPNNKRIAGEKLYNVKGRFRFSPQLSHYPFDKQRFSIDLKTVDTANPFLIQPPKMELLDQDAEMEGWLLGYGKDRPYIGVTQDIITSVVNHAEERQIQPYYKFNFTWIAKRQTLDYYVRVVIPLSLIMLVAYFSVFLPTKQVETIVGMQVTALLSTIALYFSIPKLNTETATLSDQIFVFAESMIVFLIMLSIVRVNFVSRTAITLGRGFKAMQVVTFPLLVWLMFRYVSGVASGSIKTFSETSADQVLCRLVPAFGHTESLCRFWGG